MLLTHLLKNPIQEAIDQAKEADRDFRKAISRYFDVCGDQVRFRCMEDSSVIGVRVSDQECLHVHERVQGISIVGFPVSRITFRDIYDLDVN